MKINYKDTIIDFNKGSVILAGAGPGDIKQITLKVYQALKLADVIIYDSLVNKRLLNIAKKTSKKIFGGKTKNKRACSQKEINEWMVCYAKKKMRVLRLKGGDPSFFSRGSQEINFLRKNQIKYKIFSGITSSQQAILSSKISFYNNNNICNFITGHRKINNSTISFDLKKIAKNNGRIIIYMGIGQIKKICSDLIDFGMKIDTKVFIVSNASLESERVFCTNLSRAEEVIIKKKILPPSIIIIN